MLDIIKQQHMSEKATDLGKNDQYVIEIDKKANKTELKKVIEKKFNVNVEKINIINIPHKPRRRGGFIGYKKGLKKAIIKLKHGEKIDFGKKEKSGKE